MIKSLPPLLFTSLGASVIPIKKDRIPIIFLVPILILRVFGIAPCSPEQYDRSS